MASVTGMTKEAIDELMADMVVSFRIDTNGQLIYKTRGGEEINAGPVIAPSAAVQKAWPVGSIFMSTVATNPNTLIGVGTWTRYGKGRVLVGLDEAQTEFDTPEELGGTKSTTLLTTQLPNHTHSIPSHTHSIPAHTHPVTASFNATNNAATTGGGTRMTGWDFGTAEDSDRSGTTGASAVGTTGAYTGGNTGGAGSGSPVPNLQPYQVVYMWKRTA